MFVNALQLQVVATRSVSLDCHANVPPLIFLSLATIKHCRNPVITENNFTIILGCVLEF